MKPDYILYEGKTYSSLYEVTNEANCDFDMLGGLTCGIELIEHYKGMTITALIEQDWNIKRLDEDDRCWAAYAAMT